jgi:uncharacterized protein YceH (UPF0502 family)
MEPDAVEIRVLGCLLEKQRTTPDAYPLTLNSLRLACNQSTNRAPVVDYDEETIRDALAHLSRRRWVRLTSYHGSRASKYRHLLDEALGLGDAELALLGVLMLRGAQTPGELKQRTERLHRFDDLAAIEDTLDRLIDRELVARLPRQPGQKEERYVQLLGGGEDGGTPVAERSVAAAAHDRPSGAGVAPVPPARGDEDGVRDAAGGAEPAEDVAPGPVPVEVVALRADLAELRQAVEDLRAEVAELRAELGG